MPPVARFICATIHIEGAYWHPHYVPWSPEITYLVGQLERGEETGALHWQLYAEAKRPMGFAKWKVCLPLVID